MLLRRRISEIASQVKADISASPEVKKVIGPAKKDQFLFPSGSKMLNLACSDFVHGAFATGKVVNLIGDSSSGKTLLALSSLAEMSHNPDFNEYRLIFDDAEEALEFDIEKLFEKETKDRIELIRPSNTIEQFYGNVLKAVSMGDPFVYILDSFDALTAEAEIKRSLEYEKEKEDKSGSYKTEKSRMMSEMLRVIKGKIRQTNSLLLIISQTRDNIGFGAMFQPKVRSGGKALKFYSSHEIWLAVGKKETKRDVEVGNLVYAKLTKNKLTGKRREVTFPIFYEYGADDITSCIDFLVAQQAWKKVKGGIDSDGFFDICSRNKLITQIEKEGLQRELFKRTQEEWDLMEKSLSLNRTKKWI